MTGLATVRERLLHTLRTAPVPPGLPGPGQLADTLRPDGTWPDVDYAADDPSQWPPFDHVLRALRLARSAPHRGAALRALGAWRCLDIRAGNWWFNEIGVPQTAGDALLLLADDLTARERDVWGAWLAGTAGRQNLTGQNVIWRQGIELRRGVLTGDPAAVAAAVDRMAPVLRPTDGEGIQHDLSFHQHGALPYAGGYGASLVTTVVPWIHAVHGTPWAFAPDRVRLLADFLLDGQRWALHGDGYDFTLMGREISRAGAHRAGGPLRSALALLLETGPPRRDELAAFADRLARFAAGEEPAAGPVGCRHYPRSDYLTHRRPTWSLSVRMSSTRTVPTESLNGENLRGRHLADGVAAIRVGDAVEDGYRAVLPVWDWARLPGITAEQPATPDDLLPHPNDRHGGSDDVAGWTDGRLGIAVMRLAGTHRLQDGWKAWFCFDDAVVALGAGITAPAATRPVVTTIDQRLATGPLTAGHVTERGGLAHQGRIGYVPLAAHPGAFAATGPRTGSWSAIARDGSPQPLTADVFCVGVDHGPRPRDASYAWLILPGADREATRRRAAHPGFTVLANTPSLQSVRCERTGVTLAARHDAAGLTLGAAPAGG